MDFSVKQLKYENKIRNLDVEALGEVKSTKHFPVFNIDNKEYIFKPLSKSKPFCTPCFALSEVYWSNIINNFFDSRTPIYRLSICEGYEKEVDKYRDQGTLVENIVNKDERLVNLLEYYRDNRDSNVDIDKYINYCGKYYDYTSIFNSKLIKENYGLGMQLAKQVLISILKGDMNYHYENVNFIYENDKLREVAPSIDHEFSSIFMYPDNRGLFLLNIVPLFKTLEKDGGEEEYITEGIDSIMNNINLIVDRYPLVVETFIKEIDMLLEKINNYSFKIDKDYLYQFSSFDFEEYKKEDKLTNIYNKEHTKITLDTDSYFKEVVKNTIKLSTLLKESLKRKLNNKKKLILMRE